MPILWRARAALVNCKQGRALTFDTYDFLKNSWPPLAIHYETRIWDASKRNSASNRSRGSRETGGGDDSALPKYWQSLLSLTESDDTVWKVLSLQAVERSLEHQPIKHNISQSCEDSIGVCLDWLHFSRKFHAFGIAFWANSWNTTIMYFSTIDIYCFSHWCWSCNRIAWTEVNGFDHAVLMFEQKSLIVTT